MTGMTEPLTYAHAIRLSMEAAPQPDKTVEGERRLCEEMLLSAERDLRLRFRRGVTDYKVQRVASAVQFFLDPDSPFEWMAEGIGLDPDEVRAALAGRIEVAVRRLGR